MINTNRLKTVAALAFLASVSLSAQEVHLKNIQKLTFGGDNAEAYFSPDSNNLTLQVTNPKIGAECDQIYLMNLQNRQGNTADLKLISTGNGRTTCSFFICH